MAQVIVEHFTHRGVLAFAAGLSKLPGMDQLVLRLMLHGSETKESAYDKIEVGFKKVNHTQPVEFKTTRFLVGHDVRHLRPSLQVEATVGRCRG